MKYYRNYFIEDGFLKDLLKNVEDLNKLYFGTRLYVGKPMLYNR
jgi:phenylacetate-coenzyme A ligase PaaK-like adenylate-forming protein